MLLETVQTFPPPKLWMEVCMVVEIPENSGTSPEQLQIVCKRHRKLLRRHHEFKSSKELKRYDRALKTRLDTVPQS
jgi:hypothetical protein